MSIEAKIHGEWVQVAGGVSNSYAPIGSYLAMKDNSVKPQGYLLSDGRDTTGTDDELSTKYPLLYAYLGNTNILPAELDHSVLGVPEDISTNLNHTTNSSYYTSPYDGVVIINWTPADRYKSMYWSDDGTNWTEFVHNLDTSTYQTTTVPVKKGDRLYLRDNIADNVIYARFYKQYKYIKAKDVNLSGGTQTLADRVETLETLASDVIPSGASASNKLAARNEIYILSNQYNGATYSTVNALLEKVAADMLAKGGYGGAVGSVWTGKSYFSGTYGTNGSTAGNARLHFENAQDGYTECSFSFTSSGLGTVRWFNDVTTSSVTSGSTAPITSGGVYSALNNKTSVTATSADSVYIDNDTIYYYPQTKRMLFNQCAFVYTQGSTMPAGKTLCTITIPDGITIPVKGIMIPAMLSVAATDEKLPSAVMLKTDGTIVTTNSETNYNYVYIYGMNVFFE